MVLRIEQGIRCGICYTGYRQAKADVPKDVEEKCDNFCYEVKRHLPIDKNQKVIGIMKDESRREIRKNFLCYIQGCILTRKKTIKKKKKAK